MPCPTPQTDPTRHPFQNFCPNIRGRIERRWSGPVKAWSVPPMSPPLRRTGFRLIIDGMFPQANIVNRINPNAMNANTENMGYIFSCAIIYYSNKMWPEDFNMDCNKQRITTVNNRYNSNYNVQQHPTIYTVHTLLCGQYNTTLSLSSQQITKTKNFFFRVCLVRSVKK